MKERSGYSFITKSKISAFLKCENLFRNQILQKQTIRNFGQSLYGLENEKVKELAINYFKSGEVIQYNPDVHITVNNTLEKLNNKQNIFQPVLIWEDCLINPDLIEFLEDESIAIWDFQSSINTRKDTEIFLAFYKFVADKLSLPLKHLKLLKINSNYIREDPFNEKDFFQELNLTSKVEKQISKLESLLEEMRHFKSFDSQESFSWKDLTNRKCSSYKNCHTPKLCFSELNSGNIFSLRESGNLALELYKSGITQIPDIPNNIELTPKQKIQIECERTGIPFIEKKSISEFLERFRYPLYYLDFETINPQIPIYRGSKPYQHIPFLFSLHILESKNTKNPLHYDYIQEEDSDPRKQILEILSKRILPGGTILAFNDFFERRCIQESVNMYPEFKEWWDGIKSQFLDAATPFKNWDYYHPLQKGSASLKDILPILTKTSHSHLSIQDGHSANLIYLKWIRDFPNKKEAKSEDSNTKIFQELREYCKMDSYALYLIQMELEKIVEKG